MTALWSDDARFLRWLDLELFACEAWERAGKIPRGVTARMRKKNPKIKVDRIAAIEADVKHDVIAFLTSITEQVGPDGRFLHLGLTSSDVVDTCFALQLVAALDRIEGRIALLHKVLRAMAKKYAGTVMIGRSHGIHAEPITFGVKCALWYSAFARHRERLAQLRPRIAVGKLSGAVGTYANVPPSVEKYVLKKLQLSPVAVATQVVQRDRHAEYFNALALVAATIEQVAVEIRHLQRTEVSEAAEPFGKGQKGSSAMPHKRNPILCENLTGCARLMRQYAASSMENVALWHERDISHSAVERVIGPDATILLDFMLHRLTGVLSGLEVRADRMRDNLAATHGVVFSQQLLLALIDAGMSREDAYARVQAHAMRAWDKREALLDLVVNDALITKHMAPARIRAVFDPARHLRYVQTIIANALKE